MTSIRASVASSDTSRNPAQGVRAAKGDGSKPGTTLSGVAIFTPKRQMRRGMTLETAGCIVQRRMIWRSP